MPYRIDFRGIQIHCDSVAEMVAAVEGLADSNDGLTDTLDRSPDLSINSSALQVVQQGEQRLPFPQQVVKALELLNQAGNVGVSAAAFTRALGIEHSKGIGSRLMPVKGLLKLFGIELHEVVVAIRQSDGSRHWKAGPRITEALTLLYGNEQEVLL